MGVGRMGEGVTASRNGGGECDLGPSSSTS